MTHRIGSLCSGYEGLGLAVHEVLGGELAWVADNDPGAAAILAHHFPSVPNLGDIAATDWAAVEPVAILTAGFPCQDVSCAGGRAGLREGNRTGVWAHVARAIDALRPSLVVLENVRGLLSAGADSDLEWCPWCLGDTDPESALRALGAVLGDLADLGFDADWVLVSAADVGAPHRRERIFILAWPADADSEYLRPYGRAAHGDATGNWAPGTEPTGSGGAVASDPAGCGRSEGCRAGAWRTAPIGGEALKRRRHGGNAPGDADGAPSEERGLTAPGQAEGRGSHANTGGSGGARNPTSWTATRGR
jgi:DNA (cytosine-5)-methyltransferase 1